MLTLQLTLDHPDPSPKEQDMTSGQMTLPHAQGAQVALEQLTTLQERFREGLNQLCLRFGDGTPLARSEWLRDEGRHGGGWRLGLSEAGLLNQGSLNISSVHYDDLPDKLLSSATALSCIVHPRDPRAPSLHTHVSWTALRGGRGGGWRMMADLNPSLVFEEDRVFFCESIDSSLGSLSEQQRRHMKAQGDKYFYIPSLDRHRGVAHYYLEQHQSGDEARDLELAIGFGERVIDTYLSILERAYLRAESEGALTEAQREAQLAYHSAYFLQVLTLDRGTSSGLLVHQQNDAGILGSLPTRVNRELLLSWVDRQPEPQGELLKRLVDALPGEGRIATLSVEVRCALAQVVRAHFQAHPEALKLQARGDILPPTVAHHATKG